MQVRVCSTRLWKHKVLGPQDTQSRNGELVLTEAAGVGGLQVGASASDGIEQEKERGRGYFPLWRRRLMASPGLCH